MKLKLSLLILALFFTINNLLAQKVDEFGNYIIKELTEEQALRIFGKPGDALRKSLGNPNLIKESIIQGNKVKTVVFNYGSICAPNYLGNIADLVWNGLGYGFEFGPLAAAEVVNDAGDTLHIVDDSFIRTFQGDYDPSGQIKWGWLPKEGYVDPNQNEIARLNAPDNDGDGKPDSWPENWYNPGAGKYLWPAFLGDMATAPDEEVYYVIDDYTNAEFPYYPFPNDSSKRGLGLDMEVRILQFNNPLAEDIVFLVYQTTNASPKKLNRVYFGMHGDPHVGGPSNYSDDRAFFIPPIGELADPYPQRARNMVYAWDDDAKGDGGKYCGYFGWKFLESPSKHTDGTDNDDDGITDESPFNDAGFYIDGIQYPLTYGISDLAKYTEVYGAPKPRWSGDEDGDWDPAIHDIGVDGISPDSPNYPGPDYGEGDGKPSQAYYLDLNKNNKYDDGEPISEIRIPNYKWLGSEPNFGLRDISESDQLGLTSFHAAVYTNSLPNVPMNDPLMWEWLSSETIDPNQELLQEPGDNVFNFGTGPFALDPGETQRFSMCILFGENLNDLVLNAEISTRILEADYRFAQPPAKPLLTLVPGDGKVTLYWDTRAEESVDPLTGLKDFQGYKIYRSQDPKFTDVYKITDGNGVPFIGVPLFDPNTGKYAQFDLIDSLKGFHPVEYLGRGVKYWIGNNTGLVHEYVDSTVKNGITYYYAVVSYDGGSLVPGKEIAPTECQAVITQDPITGELKYDVNTGVATPGPKAMGTQTDLNNSVSIQHVNGIATGKILLKTYDSKQVKDGNRYRIEFTSSDKFNLINETGVVDTIISKDTVFVNLSNINIILSSVVVKDEYGNEIPSDKYFVSSSTGKIRGKSRGDLPAGSVYYVYYKYYPVYQSSYLKNEDANPAFDGMRIFVNADTLGIDRKNSGWLGVKTTNLLDTIIYVPRTVSPGNPHLPTDLDFKITFTSMDTTADGKYKYPGDTVLAVPTNRQVVCPFKISIITPDSMLGRKADYIVYEGIVSKRNNNRWDPGENIIFFPRNRVGNRTSYQIDFNLPSGTFIPPKEGDSYILKTTKPFKSGDTYVFTTVGERYNKNIAKEKLNDIYVVPNPYVAYSDAEQPARQPNRRGEKIVQFRNLPKECTIRIYTIAGELVQTLHKNDDSSILNWDLLSYEGMRIAYGVYIYHVEAPGIGEKIGRLAVIK